MRQADVVLIHPPSVYDFRERAASPSPLSDVIPSSPVFEMYPLGFLTLAAHLRRHGYRVRIVNLALLMMRRRRFRPERFLAKLEPLLFGIDLHWLPHAHGAHAVAALLKRLHPATPIVFGGISATYFHEELIRAEGADFVLRGSVTEPLLLALVRELEGNRDFARVPNLTWKENGAIRINPAAASPACLDDFSPNLGMLTADVARELDFRTSIPFLGWWRHPITAVFTVRGCARHCVTCGASASAFRRFMPGAHPLLRSPRSIAGSVRAIAEITRAPIFLVGDLRDGGHRYAGAVLDELARNAVSNRIVLEFFRPPPRAFLARIDRALPHWGAELSPETHDESLRARLGKATFTNAEMDDAIETMLALNCEQLDLFYMIGLPGQTRSSVDETVSEIERLFARFDRRLSAFITPMGPFLDPGSDGFEEPERHGYILRARTLAEHRRLLEAGDWESALNYETRWMTRRDIVEATRHAAARLNDLKEKYGRISAAVAAGVRERGSLNDKAELFPAGAFLRNFRIGGILRLLARELVTSIRDRGHARFVSCDPTRDTERRYAGQ